MSNFRHLATIVLFLTILVVVSACSSDESSASHALGEVPHGTPLASLYFGGVQYTYSGNHVVAPGESTTFAIAGFNVDVAELEVVGTTTWGPGSIGEGVLVFQSPANTKGTGVYTFSPKERKANPEDGLIIETSAEWVQWFASVN